MKRMLTLALVAVLLGLSALAAPAAPAVSARTEGNALCDLAISQAGSGSGQFGRYERGSGGGGSQVVVGTEGDDVLDGGSGNDIVCGLGGNDTLIGGSGNDILVGGAGVDELLGESGGDTLYGQDGETLDGGTGRNRIIREASDPDVLEFSYLIVTPANVTGFCDVTISITGAPVDTDYLILFSYLEGVGGDYSAEYFGTTDGNGASSETASNLINEGATTNPQSAVIVVIDGTAVAFAPGGQTCE